MADKADIERHGDGYVEGRQQNEPVPQGLEDAVMQQNEARLLHSRHFVLRQGGFLEHTLNTNI